MVHSREEAVRRAKADNSNVPGTCQLWVRTLYGVGSAGDRDRDGDADAVDGWKSEPVHARHEGDRHPPFGAPVAWSGGSHGYGHRAISLGRDLIRSTDAGGSGRIATVDLGWVERHWGLHYLGWSETISGVPIPGLSPHSPHTPQKPQKPKKTRGSRVDDAIKTLKNAKGKGARGKGIRDALKALIRIKPIK